MSIDKVKEWIFFFKKYMNSIRARVVAAYKCKTVKELAKKIGMNEQTLYGYLNLKRDIPTEILRKFSQDTGMSIDWILTGEDNQVDDFTGLVIRAVGEAPQPIDEPTKKKILEIIKVLTEKP